MKLLKRRRRRRKRKRGACHEMWKFGCAGFSVCMNETNKEKGKTNNDARGTNKGREAKVEREGEKMMGN